MVYLALGPFPFPFNNIGDIMLHIMRNYNKILKDLRMRHDVWNEISTCNMGLETLIERRMYYLLSRTQDRAMSMWNLKIESDNENLFTKLYYDIRLLLQRTWCLLLNTVSVRIKRFFILNQAYLKSTESRIVNSQTIFFINTIWSCSFRLLW